MKFEKRILKNGLRIIAVPMPQSLSTTVFVITEAGSEYETKRINGVSHFLEHMCFKGTAKRSTAQLLSEELETIGAESNAFTGHEYTCYYAKAEPRHLPVILDIVSDIYLNSRLPESELKIERGVIIEELNGNKDDPEHVAGRLWPELLYGDQPAGWDILGTQETINRMRRTDLVSYRRKHYVAAGTVVVVAGKFDKSRIFDQMTRAFEGISESRKSGKRKVKEAQNKPQLLIKQKDTHQTHLFLGVRSYDIFHPLRPVLMVLAGVLGVGASSRLFLRIREELGAVYYIGTGIGNSTDHGSLVTYAGASNNRVSEVVSQILREMTRLRDEKVPDGELSKVKNLLVSGMVLSLETSDSLANFYGMVEVLRRSIRTPKEVGRAIRDVTAEQVMEVAQDIFRNENLNLAMVGPVRDNAKFVSILEI